MSKTLRDAAQAVLNRWDSPAWDWQGKGPTASLMADLRNALAAEQAQPRPVAWMAMRYGIPAQATTDEPTAIRWRNAGGDVRPLIYADAPPPAPVAQPYASEIAKIIRHARAGNMDGVRSYALLLCDKMDEADAGSSKYLRRVIAGDDGETVHLTAPPAVQPAAKHPSRETLEFLVERVAAALHAAGMEIIDDPGEAIGILAAERDSAQKRLAEIEFAQANNVLAQPAAQQTAVPLAYALELLVAAGHVTQDKVDEALQLAAKHGITPKESSDAAE